MPLQIEAVTDRAGLDRFIRVPWRIYRDDPYWVPPLIAERRGHLDRGKNPYFDHAEVAFWIARRGAAVVPRSRYP